jgi:hypothetical protein
VLDPGPVAVNWRGQAAGAVLAGLSVSALWEFIDTGATGYAWDRFLIRAVLLAALVLANFAVHLWLAGRRGKFIVVLRGYDRERVDNYRRQLAAVREQGLPDPPRPDVPIALRGYEPTQVDDWLASIASRT